MALVDEILPRGTLRALRRNALSGVEVGVHHDFGVLYGPVVLAQITLAEVSCTITCFKVSAGTLGKQNERDFCIGE